MTLPPAWQPAEVETAALRAMPPDERERYVDRRRLAELMGVSVSAVDRMVRAGMPSETWGMRARRFRPSAALAWAREQGSGRDVA